MASGKWGSQLGVLCRMAVASGGGMVAMILIAVKWTMKLAFKSRRGQVRSGSVPAVLPACVVVGI